MPEIPTHRTVWAKRFGGFPSREKEAMGAGPPDAFIDCFVKRYTKFPPPTTNELLSGEAATERNGSFTGAVQVNVLSTAPFLIVTIYTFPARSQAVTKSPVECTEVQSRKSPAVTGIAGSAGNTPFFRTHT